MDGLPDSVVRVVEALRALGHTAEPVMLSASARTAQEAADAVGVELGQIVKSVVFRRKLDDAAVIVATSGDRRVDEKLVAALVGGVRRADADFVKAATGFSIGGVAMVGHAHPPVMLIDRNLFRFDVIWTGAGHPHALLPLTPDDLERLTGAPVADVTEVPKPDVGGAS